MKTHRTRTCVCAVFLLILVTGLCTGCSRIEKQSAAVPVRADPMLRLSLENRLIDIGGKTYALRNDTTSILLMGIDREAKNTDPGYRMGGQADFLRLIVLDKKNETVHQVQIDRDTMTAITILGVLGDPAGKRTAQISLSYGFGMNSEQSCRLTLDAVSEWLCGIPIDLYLAMDMGGIAALNDGLGGVSVTLENDFSDLDPEMVSGRTLTLQGKQAEYYVRGRRYIGDGTNAARMRRQENYVSLLSKKLHAKMAADQNMIGKLYDEIQPYLTTNIHWGRLINEIWAAKDYRQAPLVKLKGEYAVSRDGFVEFHADREALQQLVIDLFCMEME